MDVKLDTSDYPEWITPQWVAEKYGCDLRTVQRRVEKGFLPPYQSPVKSQCPGWSREYFVMYQAQRGIAAAEYADAAAV